MLDELRGCAARGLCCRDAAEECGVSYNQAYCLAYKYGVEFPRQRGRRRGDPAASAARERDRWLRRTRLASAATRKARSEAMTHESA